MATYSLPLDIMSKISSECDNDTLANLFTSFRDIFDFEKHKFTVIDDVIKCKCLYIKFEKMLIDDAYEMEKFIRLAKRVFSGFSISTELVGNYTKTIVFTITSKNNISINIIELFEKFEKFSKFNIQFDVVIWYSDIKPQNFKKMIIHNSKKFYCNNIMSYCNTSFITIKNRKMDCIINFCNTAICNSLYDHYYIDPEPISNKMCDVIVSTWRC